MDPLTEVAVRWLRANGTLTECVAICSIERCLQLIETVPVRTNRRNDLLDQAFWRFGFNCPVSSLSYRSFPETVGRLHTKSNIPTLEIPHGVRFLPCEN
jgi:hypothetical protein